jgi:hypothetical protein
MCLHRRLPLHCAVETLSSNQDKVSISSSSSSRTTSPSPTHLSIPTSASGNTPIAHGTTRPWSLPYIHPHRQSWSCHYPEPSALTPSGMVIISSSVDAANRCYICGERGHSYVSCPSYSYPFCYHLIPGYSPSCPAVPFLETTTFDADEQGFRMVEAGASTLEGG